MPPSSHFIDDVQISMHVTRFIIVSKNKMALSYMLKLFLAAFIKVCLS